MLVLFQDLDAIAVTVKPGLPMSLTVGLNHAKTLAIQSGIPLIPIHHMEAHALTARMQNDVPFPFLVLLMSGGHCLLALAQDVDRFLLIGRGIDEAPGNAFDKTARRLKLHNLAECRGLSGGAAVERLARSGDPAAVDMCAVMSRSTDCNFSFAGIMERMRRAICEAERAEGVEGDAVVTTAADICASLQYHVTRHMARRLQRAIVFCEIEGLLPDGRKTLVLSGGVASNAVIRSGISQVCAHYDCQLVCPPVHLCTDNGIMIAWNGIERLRKGLPFADPGGLDVQHRCALGEDITEQVLRCCIRPRRIKIVV